MGTPMKLDPDFKEFVELLNSHDVRYLVVGGYAVGFLGMLATPKIWTSGSTRQTRMLSS